MWLLCILTAYAAEIGGTYTLSSTPAEVKASIDKGIDASVRDLPPMFRSTARSRLQDVPEVCERYTFLLDEEALSWQCDGEAPMVIPRASFGKPVRMERDGKQVSATVTVDGDTVSARLDGEQGQRAAAFTFSDAGMVARSSAKGAQLTVPLRWEVKYARQAVATP